ncbi:MAG: hypothetical protein EBT79_10480 [Actinobacteria bacterium]|nr:hypothetical protein [Actinomycetota bacterium]NBR67678.1 hypothetical protein [Actinomycetota bacterium]
MAEQLNNLLILAENGDVRGLRPADDSLKITVPFTVSNDMAVDGDLTVAGDVVSRGSVNVVIQDPVLDLGLGNLVGSQSGGFTVQVSKAAGFTALDVTAFQSKADASGDANFTVTSATTLSVGDVVVISGAADGENDGYFVVKSKASGTVSIEPDPMNGLPFAQTNFKTASGQSAKAYKVNLGVVLLSDGSLTKSAGVYWDAGTLVTAYAAPATKAAFQADGAYQGASDVTLNEAYGFGNTITTTSSNGDVVIAGTEKLNVTATNGIAVTNGVTIGGTLGVTGESTLASAIVSDLTDNRIVLAGTSGALEDSADLTFDGTDFKIASNKFTVAVASGNTAVAGTLGVTGAATLSSTLGVTGAATLSSTLGVSGESTLASAIVSDLTATRIVIAGTSGALEDSADLVFDATGLKIASDKFTVAKASGNTAVAGTLAVTGATTLSSTLGVTGAATLSSTLGVSGESTLASAIVSDLTDNRIVIAGTSGALEDSANLTFDGTDFKVGSSFTVAQSSGNSSIGGTLGVTGAATLSSTLGVSGESTLASAIVSDLTDNRIVIAGTSGALEDDANLTFDGADFKVGSSFTVTQSSGNTSIGGTLGVTGAATLSSTLGVTGESTLASATVSDLTDNRIVLAGTSGALEDSADLTFDGTDFKIASNKFTVAVASGNTAVAGTLGVSGDATFSATGGISGSPDFSVAGYAQFAGVVDINGSIDADVSGMDVLATGQAQVVSSMADPTAISIKATDVLGGIVIDAGGILNIDAGNAVTIDSQLSSNFTITANSGSDQTLTLKSSNSGAGQGIVSVEGDDSIALKTSAGPTMVQRTGGSGSVLEVRDASTMMLEVRNDQISSYVNFHFDRSAGVQLQANASAQVAAGTICAFDANGKMVAADAAAGGDAPTSAQEILRYPFAAAITTTAANANSVMQSVSGTKSLVSFDTAPTGGAVGQIVYLAGGANAGKATLSAPMTSNASIWRVGFLASTSAINGMYAVYWHPQYLGRRPVA